MRKIMPPGMDIAAEIQRLRSLMMNSTNSNGHPMYTCSKCQDTGTINEFIKRETGILNLRGEPIYEDVLKTDEFGNLPLCDCTKTQIFAKYNASSGMKPNERERTFDNSMVDEENRFAFMQAQRFTESIETHLKNGTWLYIHGDPFRAKEKGLSGSGTGKSHLTHCIGNKLTEMKQRAIYVTEDKLFEEIKSTYNRNSDETESEVLYKYQNVPILLIDDLFKSKSSDWTEDKLFHLLNNRQQPGMVTIINSNYAPNRIEENMPKNGIFIASRITGQAVLIEMIGKDRRREAAKRRMREESA